MNKLIKIAILVAITLLAYAAYSIYWIKNSSGIELLTGYRYPYSLDLQIKKPPIPRNFLYREMSANRFILELNEDNGFSFVGMANLGFLDNKESGDDSLLILVSQLSKAESLDICKTDDFENTLETVLSQNSTYNENDYWIEIDRQFKARCH